VPFCFDRFHTHSRYRSLDAICSVEKISRIYRPGPRTHTLPYFLFVSVLPRSAYVTDFTRSVFTTHVHVRSHLLPDLPIHVYWWCRYLFTCITTTPTTVFVYSPLLNYRIPIISPVPLHVIPLNVPEFLELRFVSVVDFIDLRCYLHVWVTALPLPHRPPFYRCSIVRPALWHLPWVIHSVDFVPHSDVCSSGEHHIPLLIVLVGPRF